MLAGGGRRAFWPSYHEIEDRECDRDVRICSTSLCQESFFSGHAENRNTSANQRGRSRLGQQILSTRTYACLCSVDSSGGI
jgi:hypothetical protein